jgi:hypothetical protein
MIGKMKTPQTDDLARGNHVVPTEWAEQLECERDEARQKYDDLATEHMLAVNKLAEERDEAQKELSSIHRWIERNHPDGFIDSQTYFQNLERVVDNWYDRLDRLEVDAGRFEKERDQARNLAEFFHHDQTRLLIENANPKTITEAIKRWNASTKK